MAASLVFRLVIVLTLLMATGCTEQNPSSEPPSGVAADPPLVIASWDEVQQMVAGHKGRVVVLDLWSTWCPPCMQEFPGLVELHQEFPEDVTCISVSIDFIGLDDETPESARGNVMAFLKEKRAFFENVICSDTDEVVLDKISLSSIPAVMVYGRDGQLLKRFDNDQGLYGEGFSYQDHVRPLVEEAIATK
jgi:thiol-disulfide isomerase/thioredoxin